MLPGFECCYCENAVLPLVPCDFVDDCGNMACSKKECQFLVEPFEGYRLCESCISSYCDVCNDLSFIFGTCVKCERRVCLDHVQICIGRAIVCTRHNIENEEGEMFVWDWSDVE